jgi:hypothetical protein
MKDKGVADKQRIVMYLQTNQHSGIVLVAKLLNKIVRPLFGTVIRQRLDILRFRPFSLESSLINALRNPIQLSESGWLFHLVLMSTGPINSKLFI